MSFSVKKLVDSRIGENYELHDKYVNPQFVKVLRTIGFDKIYAKGDGAYLYDMDGNEYLDFLSGYGVYNVGRNHPVIREAIKEVIDEPSANLIQMDCSIYSGLLAEELIKLSPDHIDTVYFTNSGTEAVEGAIKFARGYTQRPRIVHCNKAFHGLTTGSLSVNGDFHFREGFGDLLPTTAIPFNDLEALEKELSKKDVAAFIVEPIQGKGVNIPDADYFKGVRDLCDKYGTLLITDEIQAGLGRTGKLFAMEHFGVWGDIITISKALSGGYIPVGAILTRRDIYKKVFSSMERSVVHSSTFKENHLAMTAGLASLHVLREQKLIENSEKMGQLFLDKLQPLVDKYELFKEVRGKGLMIALEFASPSKSMKLKMAWKLIQAANKGLFAQMVVMPLLDRHRILTQVAGHAVDIVKILPPLIITEKEVNYFVESLDSVLTDCHKFPGAMWDFGSSLVKHALKDKKKA